MENLSKWVKGQYKQSASYRDSIANLEQFIYQQAEEDRKKAEEERERKRLEDEKAIKIESQSFTADTNPLMVHSSQSIEEEIIVIKEEDNAVHIATIEKHTEEQPTTSTFSKYFNQRYQKTTPLQSIENTHGLLDDVMAPSGPSSVLSESESESTYVYPAKEEEHLVKKEEYPVKEEEYSVKEEECDIEADNDFQICPPEDDTAETPKHDIKLEGYDLMLPPRLPFVKYEQQDAFHDNNLTNTRSSAKEANSVHFTCPKCHNRLLQGNHEDIELVNVRDLECIKEHTSNQCKVQEIRNPSRWETAAQLLGGPLDIQSLPTRGSVLYDRVDDVCFRFISCACDPLAKLGMVICLAANSVKTHHVGKVYLWGFQKDEKLSVLEVEAFDSDPLNIEIPNSQYSSANDMFYNL